jgi:hypothetical protein
MSKWMIRAGRHLPASHLHTLETTTNNYNYNNKIQQTTTAAATAINNIMQFMQ